MATLFPNSQTPDFRRFVEAYEAACTAGNEPEVAGFFPPPAHPLRLAVACELVCIELEREVGRGRGRPLSEYRTRFPDLAAQPALWREIVCHEYRVREEAGQRPDPDWYEAEYGIDVRAEPTAQSPPPCGVDLWNGPEAVVGPGDTARTQVTGHGTDGIPAIHLGATGPGMDSWIQSFGGTPEAAALFADLFRSAPESAERAVQAGAQMPAAGMDFVGFQLVREIGRGAFSRVFLARQSDLADRYVVLKVATDHFGESQTLAQLQHTNIVPIYSSHSAGPLQAVCMPYLGATTFADVLSTVRSSHRFPRSGRHLLSTRRVPSTVAETPTVVTGSAGDPSHGSAATPSAVSGKPPGAGTGSADAPPAARPAQPWLDRLAEMTYVDAVLTLMGRLADGLAHAHARGILHRDLKPANVLLTDDGEPMLLDFNLSEDTKQAGRAEAAGIGGTLPYMAPEHLRAFHGAPDAVDARADVYSLGVILYELLTGRHPFPYYRGSIRSILAPMIADRATAPRLRPHNPDIPPAAEAIVRRCLSSDPADRYSSADALLEDIRLHLDDRPLRHAPNPSVVERFGKWRRRNPRAVPVALLLVVVGLLSATAGLFARERDRRRGEEDARTRLEAVAALDDFRGRAFDLNYRLNTIPPAGPQLADAITRCEEILGRFGTFGDDGWAMGPEADRLAPAERGVLSATAGEYLVLLAQGRLTQAARQEGHEGRTILARALALNGSAERTFPIQALYFKETFPDEKAGTLTTTNAEILAALALAMDRKAAAVNMSLGFVSKDQIKAWREAKTEADREDAGQQLLARAENMLKAFAPAIDQADRTRTIFVNSAGNDGIPAEFGHFALSRRTISVAATDRDDKRAIFDPKNPNSSSNYGSFTTVSAPGKDIWSGVAEKDVPYKMMSGTSMASPHAAGVVALMKSVDPDLTAADAAAILIATGRPLETDRPIGPLINARAAVEETRRRRGMNVREPVPEPIIPPPDENLRQPELPKDAGNLIGQPAPWTNPNVRRVMRVWLAFAVAAPPAGGNANVRWFFNRNGQLVNNQTAALTPRPVWARFNDRWLWENAGRLNSTNLGTLFEFTAGTLKAGTFDPAPTGRVPENVRPGPKDAPPRPGMPLAPGLGKTKWAGTNGKGDKVEFDFGDAVVSVKWNGQVNKYVPRINAYHVPPSLTLYPVGGGAPIRCRLHVTDLDKVSVRTDFTPTWPKDAGPNDPGAFKLDRTDLPTTVAAGGPGFADGDGKLVDARFAGAEVNDGTVHGCGELGKFAGSTASAGPRTGIEITKMSKGTPPTGYGWTVRQFKDAGGPKAYIAKLAKDPRFEVKSFDTGTAGFIVKARSIGADHIYDSIEAYGKAGTPFELSSHTNIFVYREKFLVSYMTFDTRRGVDHTADSKAVADNTKKLIDARFPRE